jgi:hypothetical protein
VLSGAGSALTARITSPPHILDSSHDFRMEMASPKRENVSQLSHWNLFHFAHQCKTPGGRRTDLHHAGRLDARRIQHAPAARRRCGDRICSIPKL